MADLARPDKPPPDRSTQPHDVAPGHGEQYEDSQAPKLEPGLLGPTQYMEVLAPVVPQANQISAVLAPSREARTGVHSRGYSSTTSVLRGGWGQVLSMSVRKSWARFLTMIGRPALMSAATFPRRLMSQMTAVWELCGSPGICGET